MKFSDRLVEVYKPDLKKILSDFSHGKIGMEDCLNRIQKITQTQISQTSDALLISDGKYNLIAENSDDVIWTMNLTGEFTYISPSIKKLRGFTVEEAMQETITETLSPEFIPEVTEMIKEGFLYLEKNKVFPKVNVQLKQLHKDGHAFWVELNIKGIYNDSGECMGILGVSKNIDQKKLTQEKLKESVNNFKGLFNTVKEAIYIQNLQGEFLEVNKGAEEMYGYPKDYFIGKTPEHLAAEGMNDLNMLALATSNAAKGEEQEFEFWGKRYNGEIFPKLVRLYPGQYMGEQVIIALANDISEIKRHEEEIKADRNLLQTIINSAPFEIYVKDLNRKKIMSNNQGIPELGLKASDLKDKTDEEIFPEKLAEKFKTDDLSVINEGKSIIRKEECINISKRDKIWYLTSKVPWKDSKNNVKGIVGFGLNITDQKKTVRIQRMLYNISISAIKSESLHELIQVIHNELEEIIDTSNFLCALYNEGKDTLYAPYFTDEKDEIEEWPAKKSITGYTIEQKRPLVLKEKDILKMTQDGTVNLVGSMPKCWISVPLIVESDPIGALVMQNYQSEDALNETHQEILELVAHEMSIFIYKKRTEAELIKAKEKAIESDKLKSTFLANMSHEIRTPMNAIVGFSELINDYDLEKEERQHYTEIIQQRSVDLLTLIDDILDISKIEVGQIKIINSEENIPDILQNLYDSFDLLWVKSQKSSVEFKLNIETDKNLSTNTDPARVRQIITNLLSNAFKFTESGKITLGCKMADTNFVEIYVSDTGVGIEKHQQAMIFERFRQADEKASQKGGAGIGLSISKGLVEILGGRIQLDSKPGIGSTFSFTLPL
ncbi:PAS domain S-box protein [Saccharicrinis sp. FJH2]|uniref:PAS domain-containing sensor histidine kinase n=1 Tax=Saccharicrinis sp. FJH65 TaxID=3344659 RepID=UPI0035F44CDC